jgi:hypothetical protein
MATAQQVIDLSLKAIMVQGADAELQADEYNDAIFSLNTMMLAYDAQGIALGYTEVSSLSDEITVPAGALRGIIYNLAIDIAPQYGGEISPGVTNAASAGEDAMLNIAVEAGTSAMPSTLPRGTGNYYQSGYDYRFYPDLEAEILGETAGAIGLESGTEDAT